MANVLLRSPYHISEDIGSNESAKLEITIDGTLQYTIVKNKTSSSDYVLFEISELVRDYIDIKYNGATTPSDFSVVVSYVLTEYSEINGTGNPTTPVTTTFFGIDGYGYFEDGSNSSVTKGYMQSNNIIYTLYGEDLRIPVDRNNTTSVTYLYKGSQIYTKAITTSSTEVFEYIDATDSFKERVIEDSGIYEESSCIDSFLQNNNLYLVDKVVILTPSETKILDVVTLDECKYEPKKVSFINRWGALQDLWFFKKSVESMNVEKESYKSNILGYDGTYSTSNHVNRDFNVVGKESVTLSSGFLDEEYNKVFKEMMLSEKVWITNVTESGEQVLPINVKTGEITYKTSLNDKLVQYTIEFDKSFDTINNIR
jgi:hypothetical protein